MSGASVPRDDEMPVDILYVAAGTTAGLKRGDDSLLRALDTCGVSVRHAFPNYPLPQRIRRVIYGSMVTIDIHQCLALWSVTSRAVPRYRPRSIIYGSSHAAMLQSPTHRALPFAIRFDTPAQLSREGRTFAHEHWLERRRFRDARMLLPWGSEVVADVASLLPSATPAVPLPIPIEQPAGIRHDREPIAITYAGSPAKKGLDLVIAAWSKVAVDERKLMIAGIDAAAGRRFLHERGLDEPMNVEWLGLIPPSDFRALTRRAELYIAASRYENYGIAQLEALADGALLVTLPSGGPYAAMSLNRSLAPALVASTFSAGALAEALESALRLPPMEREAYRTRAGEMLRAHSQEHLVDLVRSRVVPALLG